MGTYECPVCGKKHRKGIFPHTDIEVEKAIGDNRVRSEIEGEYVDNQQKIFEKFLENVR